MSRANLDALCDFLLTLPCRPIEAETLDAAKRSLVDWFAVCVAALNDEGATLVRQQMLAWNTQGRALSHYGDRGTPAAIAMVNATLAHALDYDDVHFNTAYHPSGPTLAVTFALAMELGRSEQEILQALLGGYQVGTTAGANGLGIELAHRGWHPTGMLGLLSSTAAAGVMLRLNRDQIANAFGIAATQMAGLTSAGGTMTKPFQVGKAAMNGVISAQLAARGMTASHDTLDDEVTGIFALLLQEGVTPDLSLLAGPWQILQNGFKSYAACQLTRAPFQAARQFRERTDWQAVRSIKALVNPLAPKIAKYTKPRTVAESRFSISYAVALGLRGHDGVSGDFSEIRLGDAELRYISDLVEVVPLDTIDRSAARLELRCVDGTLLTAASEAAPEGPGERLGWPGLRAKFMAATEDAYGDRSGTLLDALSRFEEPGRLAQVTTAIESQRSG